LFLLDYMVGVLIGLSINQSINQNFLTWLKIAIAFGSNHGLMACSHEIFKHIG